MKSSSVSKWIAVVLAVMVAFYGICILIGLSHTGIDYYCAHKDGVNQASAQNLYPSEIGGWVIYDIAKDANGIIQALAAIIMAWFTVQLTRLANGSDKTSKQELRAYVHAESVEVGSLVQINWMLRNPQHFVPEGTSESVVQHTGIDNEFFGVSNPPNDLAYTVKLTNYGSTPAYKFSGNVRVRVGRHFDPTREGDIIDEPLERIRFARGRLKPDITIPPNGSFIIEAKMDQAITPIKLTGLRKKKGMFIYVYGYAAYEDAFGVERITRFRKYHILDFNSKDVPFLGGDMGTHHQGNHAT